MLSAKIKKLHDEGYQLSWLWLLFHLQENGPTHYVELAEVGFLTRRGLERLHDYPEMHRLIKHCELEPLPSATTRPIICGIALTAQGKRVVRKIANQLKAIGC